MKRSVLSSIAVCTLATAASADVGRPAAAADPIAAMEHYLENRYADDALVDVVAGTLGTLFDCVDRAPHPGLPRAEGPFAPLAEPPISPGGDRTPRLAPGEARAEIETVTCPAGSVPIRHVDLDTLKRFGTLERFFSKYRDGTGGAMALT